MCNVCMIIDVEEGNQLALVGPPVEADLTHKHV